MVLGYHGVAACDLRLDLARLQTHPAALERHIELLLGAGYRFATMADAADRLAGDPVPGLAVVTFDDGLRNNLTTALPILERLGVPATVYIATGLIGAHNPWIAPGGGGEMLTEDDIRALAGAGWEIGAHTVSHADLARLDYAGCRAEIADSRDRLAEITGQPVLTFAYPFGRYGPAAVAAARDVGMRAALTTGSGRWDRWEMTRAMISNGDPMAVVALKLADRYEPLMRTPPLRLARTASKRLRSLITRGRPLT